MSSRDSSFAFVGDGWDLALQVLRRAGTAAAMEAVIGAQVDCMIVPMSVADPHSRGGRVKMLGLAAPKRFPGAPELKTMAEQGVPVNAGTWVGIMAPAGTSGEILARLGASNRAQAVAISKARGIV